MRHRKTPWYFIGILYVAFAVPAFAATDTPVSFDLSVEGRSQNVTVQQNEPFSVTVEAVQSNLETATEYEGSIVFDATDLGATLPSETVFETSDNGVKSFDQAVTFVQTGSVTLNVFDTEDPSIVGVLQITVTGADSGTTDSEAPIITAPAHDTTVNSSVITITGTAEPLADITLLDGTEILGTVLSDATGGFSYTTDTLSNGIHTFTAQTGGDTPYTSDIVRITVDTLSAVIRDVTLTPASTAPAGIVAITVETEENLPLVEAIVDQRATSLEEDATTPGIYTGELVAPLDAGAYPVDIRVTDENDNADTFEDEATLTVTDENLPPTATITASPAGGIAPLNVSFISVAADPDGLITSYAWSFGDGGTSSQPNPQHVYIASGSYAVSLTVTDDSGDSTRARLVTNIVVTTPPTNTQDGPGTWLAVLLAIVSVSVGYQAIRKPA